VTLRIGVDIGGTFTDLVVVDERSGRVSSTKALTTPAEPARAVVACLEQLGIDLGEVSLLVHGTTVGINAVLERTGAKTALVTTAGFRDVLEIGRGDFHRMYDVLYQRPRTLVPRSLRLEATERLDAGGRVLVPLAEQALREAVRGLRGTGVQSVAIVFLFSYLDPAHERRAAAILSEELPGVAITASHRVSQEWREYERSSTAVINAYIQPTIERYLRHLRETLAQRGFRGTLLLTQSNGGACTADAALIAPVTSLESGPAAGVNGCVALGKDPGRDRVIAFDMGGTTTKCCLVERGVPALAEEHSLDGHPIRIPILDIKEVSAGGGTIAWIDAGGALRLGPRSAGADPGPVCYGRGGSEPTVTDANLVLGRINPTAFLGGRMPLATAAAAAAVDRIGAEIGLGRTAAAAGILRLAGVKMALALKSITTERGLDPRDYTLVAYGGSGPLHAAFLARELGIRRVVIPPSPSTFSAWGMLAADLRHDLVRTVLRPLPATDPAWASARFDDMQREVAARLPPIGRQETRRGVDLRYAGQIHAVQLDLPAVGEWDALRARFDSAHAQAFGFAAPDVEVELLNLRLTVTSPVDPPALTRLPRADRPLPIRGERRIYSLTAERLLPTPFLRREALLDGDRIEGPAAVEEPTTTTILEPGDRLTVDAHGNLEIAIAG
jgi:N-methylhydantoinase A